MPAKASFGSSFPGVECVVSEGVSEKVAFKLAKWLTEPGEESRGGGQIAA
jgi:hypothetical protein